MAIYNADGIWINVQQFNGAPGQTLQAVLMTGDLAPGRYSAMVVSTAEGCDRVSSVEKYFFTVTDEETADTIRVNLGQTEALVGSTVSLNVTGVASSPYHEMKAFVRSWDTETGNGESEKSFSLYPCSNAMEIWSGYIDGIVEPGRYLVEIRTLSETGSSGELRWETRASTEIRFRKAAIPPFRMTLPAGLRQVEEGAFEGVDLRVIILEGADARTDLSFLDKYDVRYVGTDAEGIKVPAGAKYQVITTAEYKRIMP